MSETSHHIHPRQVIVASLLALTLSVPMYQYVHRLPKVSKEATSAPAGLHIVSFNTQYWHPSERELVDAVSYEANDIVLFQEHLQEHPDHSWGPTNRIAQLKAAVKDRYIDAEGEVVTMSKWPIVARRGFDDGGPDGQVLRTDLAVAGRTISVYNIHLPVHMHLELLDHPGRFAADLQANARRREATLKKVTDDIAANRNPVVIGGDFNSSSAMHATQWFREHLVDVYSANHCTAPPDTFRIGKLLNWRIDYIFLSRELTPTSYCTRTLDNISDHRALLASFTVGPNPLQLSTLNQGKPQ
ncbi:MAG: endonuclease/exonuclease/phosphatase family protein [Pseudomonadota bacterium]